VDPRPDAIAGRRTGMIGRRERRPTSMRLGFRSFSTINKSVNNDFDTLRKVKSHAFFAKLLPSVVMMQKLIGLFAKPRLFFIFILSNRFQFPGLL
jgi:hypothetical protein